MCVCIDQTRNKNQMGEVDICPREREWNRGMGTDIGAEDEASSRGDKERRVALERLGDRGEE